MPSAKLVWLATTMTGPSGSSASGTARRVSSRRLTAETTVPSRLAAKA